MWNWMNVNVCRVVASSGFVFGAVAAFGGDVWVRPYIDGQEVVGTPLKAVVSSPDGKAVPVFRWERSDERGGTASVVKEGKDAGVYTLSAQDVGQYIRMVAGAGKDAEESAWIGPVITREQAGQIHSYFDNTRPYQDNVAEIRQEVDARLADAVYFTVAHGRLHGSPYAMVRGKRVALTDETRPLSMGGKIYVPEAFLSSLCHVVVPSKDVKRVAGKKVCGLATAARLLQLKVWLADEHQSPVPNFRMAHMGEGLVVLSPKDEVFMPVRDRDLVNEACNGLFDMKANDRQLQWLRDSKFGMFIHWNPSSLAEAEISWERKASRPKDSVNKGCNNALDFEYDRLYKKFNPVKYDPAAWMDVAKDSGMKYAVLTTKHHDGFSNFPSEFDVYTISKSPYGKDIVRQFADAVHQAGMKLGFYYSARDWYHPNYLTNQHYRYLEYYIGQLTELLTRYGKVDVLWFDSVGNSSLNDWDPRTVLRRFKQLQPDILVNDRMNVVRMQRNDFPAELKGDFKTPECRLGGFDDSVPWESCMTVANVPNTGWTGSWSYSSKAKTVPVEKSIMFLVNNTVKDGNLLYNIGPAPDGTLVPEQADVFKAMGKWLKVYGEAVYGTRGGPLKNQPWGGSCYKVDGNGKKTVYVHVCPLMAGKGNALTGSVPLELKDLKDSFTEATVIDDSSFNGKPAKLEKTDNGYSISLPEGMSWNAVDTVIRLR
ncbi:alpha-l-fucosidase [Akkermansia glycaniphila]|uniref:alpha-L-fucosidase n=2 Tax=Akkermansia glycaniphila TaxID=1679444 RepID=A0A1H6L863_9BACT|nr:alpha-l-fucosidase [Akkermansia glycaniphila]